MFVYYIYKTRELWQVLESFKWVGNSETSVHLFSVKIFSSIVYKGIRLKGNNLR